jgi:UDP-2,4-diacetamido-2,4,6-trideoxy-beta-L-altropyranose hydrolase
MRVALLPAVGEDIGIGHLQRCVTLGRALRVSGHLPAIVIDLPDGRASDAVHALVPDTIEVVRSIEDGFGHFDRGRRVEWVVVDDYASDAQSDRKWRRSAEHVFVIDDHASRTRDADILLSQALIRSPNDYEGLVPDNCWLLSGPRYALVRPEFGTHKRASSLGPTSAGIRSVFVSMGGTDAGDSLRRVICALAESAADNRTTVHVMISTLSRAAAWLDDLIERLPYECVVHRDLVDPVKVMSDCDVAVTAGGMTSFELATLEVPSVIVPSTSLEAAVARVLAKYARVHVIDTDDPQWENKLLSGLRAVSRDSRRTGPNIFDGGGARRVVQKMQAMTRIPRNA